MPSTFLSKIEKLLLALRAHQHRNLFILRGELAWQHSMLCDISHLLIKCNKDFRLNNKTVQKENKDLTNHIELPWYFYQQSCSKNLQEQRISFDDITIGNNDWCEINRKNFRHYLGTETQVVVVDGIANNIDVIAALSGTITAGGIMIILDHISDENSAENTLAQQQLGPSSVFSQWFIKQAELNKAIHILSQSDMSLAHQESSDCNGNLTSRNSAESLPKQSAILSERVMFTGARSIQTMHYCCDESGDKSSDSNERFGSTDPLLLISQDQQQALTAIETVYRGHRNRPLVITADRGRGKSSSLAIAATKILLEAKSPQHIGITAPAEQAVAGVFKLLSQLLPDAQTSKNVIQYQGSTVKFYAIDQLIAHQPELNLLLIDEAAAIPVYMLKTVVTDYRRVVLSSTVHGYEGAGRGFTLKFFNWLEQFKKGWQHLHLEQAIRWAKHDPLEQFIFDSCLLNAELGEVELNSSPDTLSFHSHSKTELLNNRRLLCQLFAVLVTAHYQTSPSDLEQIFDNDNLQLVSLQQHGTVIAVAMLMTEGVGVSKLLAEQIRLGQRRVKNQFLPQTLLSHAGFSAAFDFKYCRIMRIAVHPAVQGQTIGQTFLAKISDYAEQQAFDFVGSSFGANSRLLKFWLSNGFVMARLGFTADKASGEHSAIVLRALNHGASQLSHQIARQFYQQLNYWLVDEFSQLAPKLVHTFLSFADVVHTAEHPLTTLVATDRQAISDYAQGHRQFSPCVYSLARWLTLQCQSDDSEALLVLIARILQKHSDAEVCRRYQLTGKKQLQQYMQKTIASRLSK